MLTNELSLVPPCQAVTEIFQATKDERGKQEKRELDRTTAAAGDEVRFTVDSALLRELGERLVGKPHIALAELVKNSYDADAMDVVIRFTEDCIQVIDNGHGMDEDEFRKFWMRIGSSHKHDLLVSRHAHRPLTGSKGVGRLAVQFLAKFIQIRSVSELNLQTEITASVDWDKAIAAGDLVKATARFNKREPVEAYTNESRQGTEITLRGLNQAWDVRDFQELAREVWSLQPPFRGNLSTQAGKRLGFSIKLETPETDYAAAFQKQMAAALNQWEARIVGRLVEGKKGPSSTPMLEVTLTFDDNTTYKERFPASSNLLGHVEFEIRVFRLSNKMKQGVKVGEARDYFRDYGGVHVYDAGFHLPYYGPDTDWLDIERDHARRLSQSKLLPEAMQVAVARGLNFLPSQRRLFGVVRIDTNSEYQRAISRALEEAIKKNGETLSDAESSQLRREAEKQVPYLKVQVTRDRLVDNESYALLGRLVRTSLDFYSVVAQKRNPKKKNVESAGEEIKQLDAVITAMKTVLPETAYMELRRQFSAVKTATKREEAVSDEQFGMLGALATAGISALAYDHELNRQINQLDNLGGLLASVKIAEQAARQQVAEITSRLREWVQRARETRKLYSHLVTEESREFRQRFRASNLLHEVEKQTLFFLRGVPLQYAGFDEAFRLPEGSFAEWSSLFQNVYINAFNAMLDAERREISVFAKRNGMRAAILVEDTGIGVDLAEAEKLFEPFERRLKLSPERSGLGLGGTGLGLTIVRMLAERLQCRVQFVKPSEGFNTAFELSWKEHG